MPREIFGNELPPIDQSKDSDIFHNLLTNDSYVFDNGQWNKLPQEPSAGGDVPSPSFMDAGKTLKVNFEGKYALERVYELPAPTPQKGAFTPKVNTTGNGYELKYVPTIPTPSGVSDAGKSIVVASSGMSYELGAGGGESNIVFCDCVFTGSPLLSGYEATPSMTVEEIISAIAAGKAVVARSVWSDTVAGMAAYVCGFLSQADDTTFFTYGISGFNSGTSSLSGTTIVIFKTNGETKAIWNKIS